MADAIRELAAREVQTALALHKEFAARQQKAERLEFLLEMYRVLNAEIEQIDEMQRARKSRAAHLLRLIERCKSPATRKGQSGDLS